MSDKTEPSEQNVKKVLQAAEDDSTEHSSMDHGDILASLKQRSLAEEQAVNTQILLPDKIKSIVEAAILAATKTISLDKLLSLFIEAEEVDKNKLRDAVEQLKQDYQSRGIELIEVSSGYRFQVAQNLAPWVSRLWEEKPQKYSRALLETLALVAYRQPVTRGEIEEIRGVSVSSHIMRTLVDREWVRIIGHRDVPGKPAMYATTKQFLDYFGLIKLDELPTLSEIRDLDVINAELDFGQASGSTPVLEKDVPIENNTADNQQEDNLSASSDQIIIKEGEAETAPEVILNSEHEGRQNDTQSQRIDIEVELNALKETYQQIDAIEKEKDSDHE